MILAQEYSDKNVTAWGGMQARKATIQRNGVETVIIHYLLL